MVQYRNILVMGGRRGSTTSAEALMSDEELVRQALAGSSGAYEQLARRWSPRVLAVCHARLGRSDWAEDLAQETLLRGLKSLPRLSQPAKFGPWLCGIASRACLDWIKSVRRGRERVSSLDEQSDFVDEQNDSASASEQQDEVGRLMSQVQRLPMPYREVLMHYYYDDCTYEQLAELLGVSAATVNARLTKARQMLREKLGVER
jgi:RNA polymerase sigma-70 factor, ECF subfamily